MQAQLVQDSVEFLCQTFDPLNKLFSFHYCGIVSWNRLLNNKKHQRSVFIFGLSFNMNNRRFTTGTQFWTLTRSNIVVPYVMHPKTTIQLS